MPRHYGKATGYSCSCFDKTCDMSCNMYRLVENKPSNADRIRAMTDEELAEWLAEYAALLIANVLDDDYLVQTKSGWLDWLKWEA